MSKTSKTTKKPQRRVTVTDKLDKMLAKREKYAAKIAAADARKAEGMAKVEKRYAKDAGKAPEKLERLDADLATFTRRHRYWLTRLHSKTVQRLNGVIKFMTATRELDLPENMEPLIQDLLERRGGKDFLIISYKIDRKKLLNAPAGIWAIAARHGAWRGRHRTISVTSPSSKVKRISRERYNDRS